MTPEPDPRRAGTLIGIRRRAAGMSAGELSLGAGLSRSYVAKLESGELAPSLRALGNLARVLQMTPLEIYAAVMFESA